MAKSIGNLINDQDFDLNQYKIHYLQTQI